MVHKRKPKADHSETETETATPPEGPPQGAPNMKPPAGFKAELYPLRHKLKFAFGLSPQGDVANTYLAQLIHATSDLDKAPEAVFVNPHSDQYMEETGPAVQQMSIIDRLTLSLRFNMTVECNDRAHTSGQSTSEIFSGDGLKHLKFLWRPIFFSFPEKLDAADDDTTTTVATILALTKDATFQDVVPITTNDLPAIGNSDLLQPKSTVNQVAIFGDFNLTTDFVCEDHVWDENLFQDAIRRYTNKGALKACVGRTRYVNLTQSRPYKSFFINKFVPRAVRRIVPYSFFGIQIHVPIQSDADQDYFSQLLTGGVAHIGCKIIARYHEWHPDFEQTQADA